MRLSEDQQEQLLLNRRSHLQRMRAIYQERHNLNMQVGVLEYGWVDAPGRGWA